MKIEIHRELGDITSVTIILAHEVQSLFWLWWTIGFESDLLEL